MADIRSSQVIGQVEWQIPSLVKSSQVIAQIEYTIVEVGTYTGDITFELTPESETTPTFICTGDISFSLIPESEYGLGFYYTGGISLSLTPESDYVVSIVYVGDISLSLTPESEIIGDYCYDGLITFDLIPESLYATPILGFDWYSGYGLVDLTFLDGNPPYYVVEGDISVSVTLSSTIAIYAEYEATATGGISISGEGIAEFETPPVLEVVATGGLSVGGRGIAEFSTPKVFELIASGRIKVNGEGTVEFVEPVVLPVFELIASGGIKINGEGIVEFPELVIYEIAGSGGIKIAGAGVIEFPELPSVFAVIATGGIKIGSESIFEFFVPDVVFELVASGGLEISGESIFVYICPLTFEVVGDGGIEIGGEYETYIYHTWVITGLTFEPSVYSGFDFNSYSEYQSKYYGLKDDGLYLLEGATDNGKEIHSGINLGANNFGKEGRNKLRSIRFGDRDGNNINVKVSSDTEEAFAGLSRNRKAVINRSVFGDDLDVSIADFEKLGSMELALIYRK